MFLTFYSDGSNSVTPFVVVVAFLLFLRRFVFNPRDTVEPDGWTAQSAHTYPDEDVSPPLSPMGGV